MGVRVWVCVSARSYVIRTERARGDSLFAGFVAVFADSKAAANSKAEAAEFAIVFTAKMNEMRMEEGEEEDNSLAYRAL